jgi:hypothetical protein
MAKKKADPPKTPVPKAAPKPVPKKATPDKAPVYKGIRGYLSVKQKKAVDALESELRALTGPPAPDAEIKVHGMYARALPTRPFPKAEYIDVWRVDGVSLFVPGERAGSGGVEWSGTEPECVGVLAACREVLETHGRKPVVSAKTKEVVADDHAEALGRLRFLWNLPEAAPMRQRLCYLLWLEKTKPGITLSQALGSRMRGFYLKELREEMAGDVNTLGFAGRDELEARFTGWAAHKPSRLFELHLGGYGEGDDRLKKVVRAAPDVFHAWLARTGLREYLHEEVIDLAERLPEGERDEFLRRGPWPKIDLILGLKQGVTTFETQDEDGFPSSADPAEAWKRLAEAAGSATPDARTAEAGAASDTRDEGSVTETEPGPVPEGEGDPGLVPDDPNCDV